MTLKVYGLVYLPSKENNKDWSNQPNKHLSGIQTQGLE